MEDLFKGRYFDHEVIILCVRWYLRFKLSFRNLVEMMEERGLSMAHTTIMRWVHHYSPEFERRFQPGSHTKRATGASRADRATLTRRLMGIMESLQLTHRRRPITLKSLKSLTHWTKIAFCGVIIQEFIFAEPARFDR